MGAQAIQRLLCRAHLISNGRAKRLGERSKACGGCSCRWGRDAGSADEGRTNRRRKVNRLDGPRTPPEPGWESCFPWPLRRRLNQAGRECFPWPRLHVVVFKRGNWSENTMTAIPSSLREGKKPSTSKLLQASYHLSWLASLPTRSKTQNVFSVSVNKKTALKKKKTRCSAIVCFVTHLLCPEGVEEPRSREEHHLLEEREAELGRRLRPHLYGLDLSRHAKSTPTSSTAGHGPRPMTQQTRQRIDRQREKARGRREQRCVLGLLLFVGTAAKTVRGCYLSRFVVRS